jgi:hypothetical protein
MPPYKAVKSKAQSRKLFALAAQGKISEAEARGKTKAANFSKLPQHVKKKKSKSVAALVHESCLAEGRRRNSLNPLGKTKRGTTLQG